ncbi:MAG: FAD-dependent oxidoreductase, partial [Planctomycetota bacterium]
DGRRVHAVMSASRGRAALAPEEVVRRVCRDVAAWLPHARDARLVWSRVVKERRATFAATPEGERARPPIVGTNGMDGLLLAGDYVQTGWPATMEGAARAGFAAAAAVLGVPASEVVPPPMAPGVISAAMGLSAVGAEGVERR